jgi:hypothetical protein
LRETAGTTQPPEILHQLPSSATIEQNQSEYALLESLRGGFFLRKKPLEDIASGYSNSGFAIAQKLRYPHWGGAVFHKASP